MLLFLLNDPKLERFIDKVEIDLLINVLYRNQRKYTYLLTINSFVSNLESHFAFQVVSYEITVAN